MKKLLLAMLALLLVVCLFACQTPTPDTPDNPDTPNTPDEPDTPNTPDEPDTPDTPDMPDEPQGPYELDFDKDIKALGRTYRSVGNFMFDWSGSGMEFCFKGTSVKATLGYQGSAWLPIEVTCFVDGVRTAKVELSTAAQEFVLAENLEDTEHTVKIVKSAMHCTTATYAAKVVIDGKILPAPAKKDLQILALGDSLSAGRAALGKPDATSTTRNIDDCTYATPWLIAEHLDADLELIADTGYGIYQSSGSDKNQTIPKAWKCESYATKKPYDFSKSSPDLIIINLGTNDVFASTPTATFKEYLTNFLNDVREQYPETPIFYYYGMLKTDNMNVIKSVINERKSAGDDNIYFMQLDKCSGLSNLGSMSYGHPVAAQYEYYAEKVVDKLEALFEFK